MSVISIAVGHMHICIYIHMPIHIHISIHTYMHIGLSFSLSFENDHMIQRKIDECVVCTFYLSGY